MKPHYDSRLLRFVGPVAYGGNNSSGAIDVATALNAHGGPCGRLDFESETFIAFSCKDHGGDAGDVAPTLRAMGHGTSHANAGGQVAVAFHPTQDPISSSDGTTHAVGCGSTSGQASIAVAVALRGRDGGATAEVGDDCAFSLRASSGGGDKPHALLFTGDVTHAFNTANNGKECSEDGTGRGVPTVAQAMAVRRLTPRECERLQGFADDWTNIPWRTWQESARKGASYEGLLRDRGMNLRGPSVEECPDGPRYKAIGNSWAVPVARWVGQRIVKHLEDSAMAQKGA